MTVWYLARAAGVMALVMFTVAASLGALGAGSKHPEGRFWLQYVHRSAAITGLALLATHVAAVIADPYASVSTSVLIWPLGAGYRPFAMLLGVLALYGLVLAALVGAARGRLARFEGFTKRWRLIHIAASLGWLLSIGHSLLAGTDRGTPWMLAITIGCVLAVGTSVAVRMRRQADHVSTRLSLARARRLR
jgi:methionine sulfoxide reductase heme-binding subunit